MENSLSLKVTGRRRRRAGEGGWVGATHDAINRVLELSDRELDQDGLDGILELLKNAEPSFREVGLRALGKSPTEVALLLESYVEVQEEFLRCLTDLIVADESPRNRLFALIALGKALPSLEKTQQHLEHLISESGRISLSFFCKAFESKEIEQCILAVCAFGPFLERGTITQVEDHISRFRKEAVNVMNVVCARLGRKDPETSAEVNVMTNPYLVASILRVLYENVSDTPKRRANLIDPLSTFVRKLFLERNSQGLENREVHFAIRTEASRFLCKFWNFPQDTYIRSLSHGLVTHILLRNDHSFLVQSKMPMVDADLKELLKRANERRAKQLVAKVEEKRHAKRELEMNQQEKKEQERTRKTKKHRSDRGPMGGYLVRKYQMLRREDAEKARRHNKRNGALAEEEEEDEEEEEEGEDSSGVQAAIEEIECNLSFNVPRQLLVFPSASNTITAYLTNRSSKRPEVFCIQTYPTDYFYAVPAYGVVKPNSSLPIQIHFLPDMKKKHLAGLKINGFLRLRTVDGFPGERVSLSAFHGPILSLFDSVLDFGYFPFLSRSSKGPGGKTLPLFISNTSSIACNCSVSVDSQDTAFSITRPYHLILPGQTITVDVTFKPTEAKQYVELVRVHGMCSEVHTVKLVGHGGQPLYVPDLSIDFGQINLTGGTTVPTYTRKLTVQNKDEDVPLSVSFMSSEPEILFASDTLVRPKHAEEVLVHFRPKFGGVFHGCLSVLAPESKPVKLPVTAFVGSPVGLPYAQEIYLPAQPVGSGGGTIELDLVNFSEHMVECFLSTTANQVFTLSLETRRNGRMEPPLTSDKPFQLEPLETAKIFVRCNASTPGFFRIPVRVEEIFPNRLSLGPWYLMCAFVGRPVQSKANMMLTQGQEVSEASETSSTTEKHPTFMWLSELMNLVGVFLSEKEKTDRLENLRQDEKKFVQTQNEDEPDEDEQEQDVEKTNNSLRLSKSLVALYGLGSRHARRQPTAEIELRNASSEPQACIVILSKPFYLASMGGYKCFLEPHDSVTLQLRIDPDAMETAFPHFGFLSVLKMSGPRLDKLQVICSAQLLGTKDTVLSVYVGDGPLSLLGCVVNQKEERSICLRNLSPLPLRTSATIQIAKDASPFLFARTADIADDMELEPWQAKHLVVEYLPRVIGTSSAPLQISYVDPFLVDSEDLEVEQHLTWQSAHNGMLEGAASSCEALEAMPDEMIDFGDVSIGRSLTKSVVLKNTSLQDISIMSAVSSPFLLAQCSRFLLPRPKKNDPGTGETQLDITFAPKRNETALRFLSLVVDNDFSHPKTVAVRARAGDYQLISNFGLPYESRFAANVPQQSENQTSSFGHDHDQQQGESHVHVFTSGDVIDFGVIFTPLEELKTKELVIRNTGKRAMVIQRVECDSNWVRWKQKALNTDTVAGIDSLSLENHLRAAEIAFLQENSKLHRQAPKERILERIRPLKLEERDDTMTTIDWDELDFQLGRVISEAKAKLRASQDDAQLPVHRSQENQPHHQPRMSVRKTNTRKRRRSLRNVADLEELDTESGLASKNEESAGVMGTLTALMQERMLRAGVVTFPIIVESGKEVRFEVEVEYDQSCVGDFHEDIKLVCTDAGAVEDCEFVFRVTGTFQPSLTLSCSEEVGLHFGIVGCGNIVSQLLELSNPGQTPCHWDLSFKDFYLEPLDLSLPQLSASETQEGKAQDQQEDQVAKRPSKVNLSEIQKVFGITPSHGVLEPGKSEKVKIIFCPNEQAAAMDISCAACIRMRAQDRNVLSEQHVMQFPVSGSAGIANLRAVFMDVDEVESNNEKGGKKQSEDGTRWVRFGGVKTGKSKTKQFRLVNTGNLGANFSIQSNNSQFSFEPTQGSIPAGSEAYIDVTFCPLSEKLCRSKTPILWFTSNPSAKNQTGDNMQSDANEQRCLDIGFSGSGGQPRLEVRQMEVDFENAIVGCENEAELVLHNTGSAETMATFRMPRKNIFVRALSGETVEVVPVPAKSWIKVKVVFVPENAEPLQEIMVLSSIWEGESKYHVDLVATVGTPELTITPESALEYLDFDVALIKQTHVRSFSVTNIGDVDVPFTCKFLRPTKDALAKVDRLFAEKLVNIDMLRPHRRKSQGRSSFKNRNNTKPPQNWKEMPWLDLFSLEKDFEVFEPKELSIEPREGNFGVGLMVHFTASFEPQEREVESHAILVLENRFKSIVAEVKGVGGDPLLELDTPLKVVDFGLCQPDQEYVRNLNVMNAGNISYSFCVLPDPNDAKLRATMMQYGWNGDFASMLAASLNPDSPEAQDPSTVEALELFQRALAKHGFRIVSTGQCGPFATSPIEFHFHPSERLLSKRAAESSQGTNNLVFENKVHIRHATGYEQLTLLARIGSPYLSLYDMDNTPFIEKEIDLGTCPISQTFKRTFLLHNSGNVQALFIIQRNLPRELQINPMQGEVAAGEFFPIEIAFSPFMNCETTCTLTVMYNAEEKFTIMMRGVGGSGVLEPEYLSERDEKLQGLDFQLVPTRVPVEKCILIHNRGQVPLTMTAETTTPQYALQAIGPRDVQKATGGYRNNLVMAEKARTLHSGHRPDGRKRRVKRQQSRREVDLRLSMINRTESPVVECVLEPSHFVILKVVLIAEKEAMCTSLLKVRSEFDALAIPLRARGGLVKIKHSGSLDFGNIACDHTYTKKLQLFNTGTIPSGVELYWKMKFGSRESFEIAQSDDITSVVLLRGTSTHLGRKRLWHWAIDNVLTIIRQERDNMRSLQRSDTQGRLSQSRQQVSSRSLLSQVNDDLVEDESSSEPLEGLRAVGELVGSRVTRILERFERYQTNQESLQEEKLEKLQNKDTIKTKEALMSFRSQRLQSFMRRSTKASLLDPHADESFQERCERELEESGFSIPHLFATPKGGTLSQRLNMEISVSINTSIAGPFSASLVVASTLPGVPLYEIPVTANAQEVLVVVDDPNTINFGRQALGEYKMISRNFTNKGSMPAMFRIRNNNEDLSAEPSEGTILPGQTTKIEFVYTPTSEALCAFPVYFETDCTAPIILDLYAGGGNPELDLDHYEVFSFGRCMVGKSIPKQLRIGNSGNAVLTITGFQFHDQRGKSPFEKGDSWPHGVEAHNPIRVSPGESYYLPLVFHPQTEEKFESAFSIHTTAGSYTLDLIGMGREAVLSLSVSRVEFVDCIVGNAYQSCFEVSNAGDLNYPLEATLVHFEAPQGSEGKTWSILDDLKVEPKQVTIPPFEKQIITVTYIPTRPVIEKTGKARISLSSIYSNFEVPLKLVSGTADLVIDPPEFDFGHFEKSKPCERLVTLQNVGSMSFGFRIKRASDGLFPFKLSKWEALLGPGDSITIACTYQHSAPGGYGKQGQDKEVELDGEFCEELVIETDLVGSFMVMQVRGVCDASALDPEEFGLVNFGACTVGELACKTVSITNKGGYPAHVKLNPSYPLKVIPRNLEIAGRESATFQVQWKPMGGYELRSVVKILSNVGQFESSVWGIGVYPRFKLDGNRIDFGVCAPGVCYERTFSIRNCGKVAMDWSIPALADGYTTSQESGTLEVKEEVNVTVSFRPLDVGPFPGDFIVESRGRYKIVSVHGVGGVFKFALEPSNGSIELGEVPCNSFSQFSLVLVNEGGVRSNFGFRLTETENFQDGKLQVIHPKILNSKDGLVSVGPRERKTLVFQLHPGLVPKSFSVSAELYCHEAVFPVHIRGTGHVIELRPETQQLLSKERLASTWLPNPLVWNTGAEELREPGELDPTLEATLSPQCVAQQSDIALALLEPVVGVEHDSLEQLLLPPIPVLEDDVLWGDLFARGGKNKKPVGPILDV